MVGIAAGFGGDGCGICYGGAGEMIEGYEAHVIRWRLRPCEEISSGEVTLGVVRSVLMISFSICNDAI